MILVLTNNVKKTTSNFSVLNLLSFISTNIYKVNTIYSSYLLEIGKYIHSSLVP